MSEILGNDGLPWPRTMDAVAWAKAFLEHYPNIELDEVFPPDNDVEGILIGWFANAIMCGHDTALDKVEKGVLP